MQESNVRDIWSGNTVSARQPNPEAIEALEKALEQAKAGEIKGIAIAKMHHDNLASFVVYGDAISYQLIGALDRAKNSIHVVMDDSKYDM